VLTLLEVAPFSASIDTTGTAALDVIIITIPTEAKITVNTDAARYFLEHFAVSF
jgi:hypothetical protein